MKTLVLDIETSPNLAHVWGLWDQNIPINMLEVPSEVICFSAKWVGEKQVYFYSRRDVNMFSRIWALLDLADAVVHYNGKKFDVPHLNTEFKNHLLLPPSPFKQIDLLHAVKSRFALPSYKLAYVARWLNLPGKEETGGFELWKGVMANDEKSWKKMEKYNKQDVVLTEQVYDSLFAWIPGLPNNHLYEGGTGCPYCGSDHIQKRGFAYTGVSKYQQYQCTSCGRYFRDTTRILGVKKTESVL